MSSKSNSSPEPESIVDLFMAKHPDSQFGMKVLIDMKAYKKWQIERALKARRAKPRRRFKNRRPNG